MTETLRKKTYIDSEHSSNKKTKVGVLIAVCDKDNPEHFRIALESIFEQDIDAEIRVYLGIDGLINDKLSRIITYFNSKIYKISYSQNQDSKGLAATLNRLIQIIEDEDYYFRMDSDDVCLIERFRKQVQYMESNPKIDVSGSSMIETDFNNYSKIISYPTEHSKIKKVIYKRNPLGHPTVCFRAHVLKKERYLEQYWVHEDIIFWSELLAKGYVFGNLNEPLLLYRSNELHLKRSNKKVSNMERAIYIEIIDKLKLNPIYKFYPYLRYYFRLLPSVIQKRIYQSFLRSKI